MKKILYLFIMLVILSCTEIGVIEEDIPFEGKYVVYGRLQGGTNLVNIRFSNTFSLDQKSSLDDSAIKNITPYLWSEDQGIYPLIHIGEGQYLPIDNLEVNSGDWYEIHAKIGSERIFANTYIPSSPNLEEIELIDDYVSCKITSEKNVVFGVKYSITSKTSPVNYLYENTFFEISDIASDEDNLVSARTSSLPKEYLMNINDFILDLEIYAFDQDYKAYYNSRQNNKPVENIFSEGGGSVFWNVQGDDVIGMFIGYTIKNEFDIKID